MKTPTYIQIHHTAVSYDKNKDQFKAVDNYHKNLWNRESSLGYFVGYHYMISKKGRVRQARADGEVSVACPQKDMNDGRAVHIALDGNFDLEKPFPNQIFALRDLLRRLVKKHGIKKAHIVPHREYAAKSCPGANVEMAFIRSLVEGENEDEGDSLKSNIMRTLARLNTLISNL